MAKVQAQVLGGGIQEVDSVRTVGDVKTRLGVPNHAATVNGNSVRDSYGLSDYEFVSLSPAVKGGKVILRKRGK